MISYHVLSPSDLSGIVDQIVQLTGADQAEINALFGDSLVTMQNDVPYENVFPSSALMESDRMATDPDDVLIPMTKKKFEEGVRLYLIHDLEIEELLTLKNSPDTVDISEEARQIAARLIERASE